MDKWGWLQANGHMTSRFNLLTKLTWLLVLWALDMPWLDIPFHLLNHVIVNVLPRNCQVTTCIILSANASFCDPQQKGYNYSVLVCNFLSNCKNWKLGLLWNMCHLRKTCRFCYDTATLHIILYNVHAEGISVGFIFKANIYQKQV